MTAEFFKQIKKLRAAFSLLTPRERQIVEAKWGIVLSEPKNLRQAGDVVGITREGARQAYNRAIKKIKEVVE